MVCPAAVMTSWTTRSCCWPTHPGPGTCTVDRVRAQPGVESVEVGEPSREVGHAAAEQFGPDDQLLQRPEIGDRRWAVGVGGEPWPDPAAGGAGGPGHVHQVGAQVGGE